MQASVVQRIRLVRENNDFSGTVFVKDESNSLVELSFGYANRSEQLSNNTLTRYGIASGCKIFTAVAICQLVESGKLSFDSRIKDCVDFDFPYFDEEVTIHHLLTHTSGKPDYFDEEIMDDFEELWRETPMYHIRKLKDFLPLFQDRPMKFDVGTQFSYNNAGYILLGLIVEAATQHSFTEFVHENIFNKVGMSRSGYFEFDTLPSNTAQGYIDFSDGTWKTNIYSLPAKGGSDGGAFVTVNDMEKFWEALVTHQLLSPSTTQRMLTAHAKVDNGDNFYGYGVWIAKNEKDEIVKYHVMGYDPGVSFHSAYYPRKSIKAVVCSNRSSGAYDMMECIDDEIF
ncbi:penicillin-binding protein [Paenibacillus selenitireducens]|uniref:Penicillin-binding protein n=1 Tax=Paenibacillus selenitireducens TaxID=1324314 RepID=A0A1T2XFZ3_9BACL|nr:serine hydrolase [Paenibacillus selenitireducens]OPA78732.1 penicillin-binding protein [Paenibacillus selenitireducens]